jgi:hypothetical protein
VKPQIAHDRSEVEMTLNSMDTYITLTIWNIMDRSLNEAVSKQN